MRPSFIALHTASCSNIFIQQHNYIICAAEFTAKGDSTDHYMTSNFKKVRNYSFAITASKREIKIIQFNDWN
jgi:hypothetical protein